jgi:tetratricopeptide (TPR) repeat protein
MARGRWLPLAFTLIATMVLLLGAVPTVVQAQGADDLTALQRQVSRLHGLGMYGEAIPLARRYVVVARQNYGEEHPRFGTAITLLADVYRAQGRTVEAEPLYQRALGILEKALGPDHPSVGALLNRLADVYRGQGRHAEAETLYQRDSRAASPSVTVRRTSAYRPPAARLMVSPKVLASFTASFSSLK